MRSLPLPLQPRFIVYTAVLVITVLSGVLIPTMQPRRECRRPEAVRLGRPMEELAHVDHVGQDTLTGYPTDIITCSRVMPSTIWAWAMASCIFLG